MEMHPASHLDSTLCAYCDHRYLDGEAAELGEKLRASLAAFQPEWIGHQCARVPRFMQSLRGLEVRSTRKSRTAIPEAVAYAISGIMIRRGQDEMALFNRALFSTYLRPSGLMAIVTLDVPDAPPAVSHLKLCPALIVSLEERKARTKTGGFDMTVILDDVRDRVDMEAQAETSR